MYLQFILQHLVWLHCFSLGEEMSTKLETLMDVDIKCAKPNEFEVAKVQDK